VRILHGIRLHWRRHTPIGVSLPQHGIDGASQYFAVRVLCRLLLLRLRIGGVKRHVIALGAKLRDTLFKLGDGGGHVGEFDDICLRSEAYLPKMGKVIRDTLVGLQFFGELR